MLSRRHLLETAQLEGQPLVPAWVICQQLLLALTHRPRSDRRHLRSPSNNWASRTQRLELHVKQLSDQQKPTLRLPCLTGCSGEMVGEFALALQLQS